MRTEYMSCKYQEAKEDIDNVRTLVYVVEQEILPELEFIYEEEPASIYFLARADGNVVGIARFRVVNSYSAKMERVAVLKEYRGYGIAKNLVLNLIRYAEQYYPEHFLYAYAQVEIITLYTKVGFLIVSETFLEDGTDIPHQTIVFPKVETLAKFLECAHIEKKTDNVPYQPYDVEIADKLKELYAGLKSVRNRVDYCLCKYIDAKDDIDRIRNVVYVIGLSHPKELEFVEEEEPSSIYFLAKTDGKVVGIARLRIVDEYSAKMERVAILKEYRGRGIAQNLVSNLLKYHVKNNPERLLYAFAQVEVIKLYTNLGFFILTDIFIKEGTSIPHQTIVFPDVAAIAKFLNFEEICKKSDIVPFQPYDVEVAERLLILHNNLESLDYFNLNKLSLFLDEKVLSTSMVKRFSQFTKITDAHFQIADYPKSEKNLAKMNELYEYLFQFAYQKLNVGHFSEVDEAWRVLFGVDSVKISDKGLCLGRVDETVAPIRKLAEICHAKLRQPEVTVIRRRFLSEELGPPLVSVTNSTPIHEGTSYEQLLCSVLKSEPIVLRKFAADMPAVQKWTFPYLLSRMHGRTFPVEVGSKYSDESWSQKMMTFGEFLSMDESETVYLAQHRVIDQVESIQKYVVVPDICYHRSSEQQVDVNMWVGPAGTISPLHTDPRDNLFVQVKGSKVVRMVHPKDSNVLEAHEGMLSNTSQLEAEQEETDAYKEIKKYDVTLADGDVLFIPKGWWHYLRSTTPSMSLSFWFD